MVSAAEAVDGSAVPADRPLIVFDGVCVLCSGWVGFVLKHDRRGEFLFADGASLTGQAVFRRLGLRFDAFESHVLLHRGRAYLRSEAGIRILQRLGLPWSLAGMLMLIPRAWRDAGYDLIARNRYRWFGRHEACYRPDPTMADRFIA